MGKRQGQSTRVVQAEVGDKVVDYEGKEVMEREIWRRIHNSRFYLGNKLPFVRGV